MIPKFLYVDKLENKVYLWVGNSIKRNNEIIALLEVGIIIFTFSSNPWDSMFIYGSNS